MIVTHNLQQAHRVADRVAFMYLGDLVEYGPAEQIFGAPRAAAHARLRRGRLRMSPGRRRAAARCRAGRWLSACQTTQELSAQRAKDAKKLVNQKGLTVSRENPDVAVGAHERHPGQERHRRRRRAAQHRQGGAGRAARVDRGDRRHGQAAVPQRRRRPRGLARLDAVCWPRARTPSGSTTRSPPTGKPAKVQARVGAAKGRCPRSRRASPSRSVALQSRQRQRLRQGRIVNRSKVAQKRLTYLRASRARAPRSSPPAAGSSIALPPAGAEAHPVHRLLHRQSRRARSSASRRPPTVLE